MSINLMITKDYAELSARAAEVIARQVKEKPDSTLGLATGSSPIGLYDCLVQMEEAGELDFSKVRSVNLDEYVGLGAESDQSYITFMKEHLFDRISIDQQNTHLPNGHAEDLDAEVRRYDAVIDSMGGIDVQLLGIGHTGHIGFNEPGESFTKGTNVVDLDPLTIEANARFFESEADVPRRAITMGIGSIMQAKKLLLVANGEGKAEIVYRALFGPITPAVPASALQLHQDVVVVIDEAAAKVIREKL